MNPHGHYRRYITGCRCQPCTHAQMVWQKKYRLDVANGRLRAVSPVGAQRRLRALATLGWPRKTLAAQTGLTAQTIQRLIQQPPAAVASTTAGAVARVYEQLRDVPYTGRRAGQVRALAAQWHGPDEWDDIDDPDETPRAVAVSRVQRRQDRLDDVEWLLSTGSTLDDALARVGFTDTAFKMAAYRAGRGDRIRRLAELGAA